MARTCEVADFFAETAQDMGWSRVKQLEILLAFVDEQGLEAELTDYVQACTEDDDVADDGDTEDSDEE